MARLVDHFIIPVYKMIFELYPPCMSQEEIEAIIIIPNWYAPPGGTFIRMFGREKPLHVLLIYATNKLVMQDAAYHISIWLSAGLHRRKDAPWPIFLCGLDCTILRD